MKMEWYKLLSLLLVTKLLLEVTVVPNLSCRFVNNYYEEVSPPQPKDIIGTIQILFELTEWNSHLL